MNNSVFRKIKCKTFETNGTEVPQTLIDFLDQNINENNLISIKETVIGAYIVHRVYYYE